MYLIVWTWIVWYVWLNAFSLDLMLRWCLYNLTYDWFCWFVLNATIDYFRCMLKGVGVRICEVVIYNYVFVGFNSVSNLIVFVQSFPCMFVGFNVRVECENLVKKRWRQWSSWVVCDWLASGPTCERSCEMHMLEVERISTRLYFASHFVTRPASNSWNSLLETFLSVLFSFLYPHYINPHYPWNCKETFKEKTLAKHLRVGRL